MAALANAFFSTQSSPLSPPLSRFFSSEIASKVHIHDALRISFHPVSGSISDRTGFRRNTKRRAPMRKIPTASSNSSNVPRPSPVSSDEDSVPTPIVLIDQDSDSEATIVHLSFGDRLGALIDTMKALKDLGLDVTKGTVNVKGSIETKFSITKSPEIFRKDWFIIERVHDASLGDQLPKEKYIVTRSLSASGRKLEDPDMLERVRLTIISNLLKYHPECSEMLAMGEAFGIKAPQKKLDVDITTYIHVEDDGPKRSMLWIECADRPGLLLEIIKIISDINITVESAEIDTEGLIAKDKFHVSYRGAALNASLSQVLTNCLRYYLRRPEADEDSY